ncbi:M23 family metallopeptidase [Mycolicibacterium gadium]|uniref:M23 family metallopeptidase n=1 Tax=Mycolicibacterium gadium TaxID=1794 RepID=UPI0013D4243D
MAQHRASRSPSGVSTTRLTIRRPAEQPAEITDIIPFNEFGDLPDLGAELDFNQNGAFDREARVIHAPELDDLHDTDDQLPQRLAVPSEFRRDPRDERRSSRAYRDSHTDVSDGAAATDIFAITRGGVHRKQEVPVKGRLMVAAMAVGATAAGAYTMASASKEGPATVLAADQDVLSGGAITGSTDGMQVVTVSSTFDAAVHAEEVTKAAAFANERAEREARLQRPMFVMPTKGAWTSGFGYRWGVLHGGIDIANAIGTPILAASDGIVIDAGPQGGYGNWVKLRHADGTVTLYGHLSAWNVDIGQRVWAGDQIAKMGNTGNSTGPHLHFEVLLNGTDRVDPVGWLSKRGLALSNYSG